MLGLLGKGTPVVYLNNATSNNTNATNSRNGIYVASIGSCPVESDFDFTNIANPSPTNNHLFLYKINTNITTKAVTPIVAYFNKTTQDGGIQPILRTQRQVLFNPDNVIQITFSGGTGTVATATWYIATGDFKMDLNRFYYLQNFSVSETYNLRFNKPLPQNLKNLYVTNNSGISMPQLNDNLKYLLIQNNTTSLTSFPNFPTKLETLLLYAQASIMSYIVANSASFTDLRMFRNVNWSYTNYRTITTSLAVSNYVGASATLNLSNCSNLTDLILYDTTVGTFNLPNLSNIINLYIYGNNSTTSINGIDLDLMVSQLTNKSKLFIVAHYNLVNKTIPNGNNIPESLEYFSVGRCGLNGSNFEITVPRPNLKVFGFGSYDTTVSSNQVFNKNIVEKIDLSGCTDLRNLSIPTLDLDDEDLILPENLSSLEIINIAGNRFTQFDFSVYPNLDSLTIGSYEISGFHMQGTNFDPIGVETRTNLQYYYAGATPLNKIDYDLTQCTQLLVLKLWSTNISGELKLPLNNTIQHIWASNNLNLTKINRFSPTITELIVSNCSIPQVNMPPLTFSNTMSELRIGDGNSMGQNGEAYPTIDLTDVPNCGFLFLNNLFVENIIFHPTASRSYNDLRIHNNNLTSLDMKNTVTSQGNNFLAYNNQLNIIFPLGTRIRSRGIQIQDNNMSQENVDGNINMLWSNRSSFNISVNYTKTFNIGGNNASPTGTYQQPVGFDHNLSDSALNAAAISNEWTSKEKLWVLTNCQISSSNTQKRYSWSFTFNNN